MSINVRTAQLSDIDGIFEVRTSVIENHLSREEMRQMGITESVVADMIEKNHCAWVATENDKIIGFTNDFAGMKVVFLRPLFSRNMKAEV